MTQQVQVSSVRFTKGFPLAVLLGDILGHLANVRSHKMLSHQMIKGGSQSVTARGKA